MSSSQSQRASELRRLIDDGGPLEMEVEALRERLLGPVPRRGLRSRLLGDDDIPLSADDRHRLEEALAGQGIAITPGLDGLRRGATVHLYAADQARESRLRRMANAVERRFVRPVWLVIYVVGTVGSAVAVLGVFANGDEPDPRKPLDGAFNIAVAEFDGGGRGLSTSLYGRLRADLKRDESRLQLGFARPENTGIVKASEPEALPERAATVAGELNADVLIYGSLRHDDVESILEPHFYVSGKQLEGAEELADQYPLGRQIRVRGDATRNPASRAELSRQLGRRVQTLKDVLLGLADYQIDRYRAAIRRFKAARATPWHREGTMMLLMLIGNSYGKLRSLSSADHYYRSALAMDGDYARARYGVAEVALHSASGRCDRRTADPEALASTEEQFQSVLRAKRQPSVPAVERTLATKVAFALGRIDYCRGEAGLAPSWPAARKRFDAVVAAYDKDPRVRDEAAEAHAYLGFMALPRAENAPPSAYDASMREFILASKLSRAADRRAHHHAMRAVVHERKGEAEEAVALYRRAADLAEDPKLRMEYRGEVRRLERR
jgi:tetratricopeptide (TPR) repeat protein